MKIKSVHLRDFKRFTDLLIDGLSEEVKLVVMVGPNGSGKTSLFEAFNFSMGLARQSLYFDKNYHPKAGGEPTAKPNQLLERVQIGFHGESRNLRQPDPAGKKVFYFRSAYRHDPDFTASSLGRSEDILADTKRPATLIASEARVSDNYQRLVALSVEALFDPTQRSATAGQITDRIVGRVRDAMLRVFGDLRLASLGDPMSEGTFFFDKGRSQGYHYKNLSGGEKAAFDLLLDFVIKTEVFNDTVFCVDEPELHMHTRLQGNLLAELYRQLPSNCQLWIATHSIGMSRRALDIQRTEGSAVAFLDFDGQDFDGPAHLQPVPVNREFWKRLFSVALDDLAELIAPEELIFCEGRREVGSGRRTPTFDAAIYRTIFSGSHPSTEFVPLGGTSEMERDALLLSGVLGSLFPRMRIRKLFDRDDRSQLEIRDLEVSGTHVLGRRDLESYLWDDEILTKLATEEGKLAELPAVLAEKKRLLADLASSGRPADDVKAVAGALYNEVRRRFGLSGRGNTAVEFARATLAPLVTRGTGVYAELDAVVFG